MAANIVPDVERVTELIRAVAAEEIVPRFQKLESHEIGEKESGEVVTAADIQTEKRLSAAFRELLPGSAVIGEEGASDDPGLFALFKDEAPVWVIDPVDGTRNFADGKRKFGVLVALVQASRTLAGWLHDPLSGATVTAVMGEGAWRDGEPLRTAKSAKLEDMTGAVGIRRWERLEALAQSEDRPFPGKRVRYGCTCHEYMDIATGKLHFAEYGILKPWDHLAGILACTEAGGHSGLMPDGAPLPVGPPLRERRLMTAHHEESWRELSAIFAD